MNDAEKLMGEDIELEMLSDSFWKELEKIKELLDEAPEDEEECDEEEAKYGDDAGTKEELQKYQEKLKVYAERIKDGLKKVYAGKAGNRNPQRSSKAEAAEPAPKNPWERGHKLGCGCAGCTVYRDFYGIKLDGKYDGGSDIMTPDLRLAETQREAKRNYAEENSPKPCGGRLHNFFHGGRAELKNILGRYTKSFNFGLAGY
jgi:hypothetical protein